MPSEIPTNTGAVTSALVTGAGGFIGRALMGNLAAAGIRARGIELPGVTRGQWIQPGDLTRLDEARRAFDAALSDLGNGATVFHLAGIASAHACRDNPPKAMGANVLATANVLEACRLSGLTRLVFPSTALVYALPGQMPLREGAPLGPRTLYASSKVAAEALLGGYAADYGLSIDIARLGNVYGPGGPADSVVVTLLRQILGEGRVQLRTLAPVRDFVHRDDVAAGLVRLAEAGHEPGVRIFNLSSGYPTSIADLAEHAGRSVGRALPPIETEPGTRQDDRIILNVQKLWARTGWKPGITLDEGLAQTLAALEEKQA